MEINEIAKKIKKQKSILLFCHARPDGDTIGSAFALSEALNKLNIYNDVVCADVMPEKFLNLSYIKNDFLKSVTKKYDAHIAVDCASLGMIGDNANLFVSNKNTIVIDHHISNERYANVSLVIDEAACSVIVFNIISALGVTIDKDIASLLYLGLCTDTCCFSHANTNYNALKTATELCKYGANPNQIYNSMYRSQSIERSKLFIETISKIKFFFDNKLAIITVKLDDLKKYNLNKSETEGFIDYPMTIKSVEVSVSILEKSDNCFKISFRSKNVNVNEIASTFGGGGHIKASGAMINGFYEDVIDKIVFTVGNYF